MNLEEYKKKIKELLIKETGEKKSRTFNERI